MEIIAAPITDGAFAPFGELVAHRGSETRRYLRDAPEGRAPAATLRMWVSRYAAPRALPVVHAKLERHPHSAQTFVPLQVSRYVVLCAGTAPSGEPALQSARAFVVGPGVGVSYRRGVWHGPMTVLDAPAEFAVTMWSAGDASVDDEWRELAEPIAITRVEP
jgi:ureidoglycolate lyase